MWFVEYVLISNAVRFAWRVLPLVPSVAAREKTLNKWEVRGVGWRTRSAFLFCSSVKKKVGLSSLSYRVERVRGFHAASPSDVPRTLLPGCASLFPKLDSCENYVFIEITRTL